MAQFKLRQLASINTPDDQQLYIARRDLSGGVNTRQYGNLIGENQATVLYNVDIGTQGQCSKRPGSVLIGNDVSDNTFADLHNYERQGYTDSLIAYDDGAIWEWLGTGNWVATGVGTFTATQTDVAILQCKESGLVPDDVFIVQNGTDDAQRFHKDSSDVWAVQDLGSGSTSPPKSTVMAWYGNRIWILKNDQLYYSDAYDDDYSTSFDTSTKWFRIPVGQERCVIPLRDKGMLVGGKNAIWGFFPSATPAATDRPEPFITGHGLVSKKGWCIAGDEVYYFAQDGLRAFSWTSDGTLAQKSILPLSYNLKDEFEGISWAYIERLTMEYFDNKIFITIPTGASTFQVWVYYLAYNSFMVITGWNAREWCKYKVAGQERLYYAKHGDGVAYRAWYGYCDHDDTGLDIATNGGMETWSGGASAAPDSWTLSGSGSSVAREGTIVKTGTYSAKLTRAGTDCVLYQPFHATKGIAYWKGKTITAGCWVYATVANRAFIYLKDGISNTSSVYHTGDSTWQYLTVTKVISDSATTVNLEVSVAGGNTSAYFDGANVYEPGIAINYQEEGRKEDLGQPLVKKSGGVIKIKALSAGNYDLTVSVSIDDQSYNTLGVLNLTGNAPVLPIELPFTLASGNIMTKTFPLDSLGEFNIIRIKIVHNATNGSDEIRVLEREIISYAIGYQDEG
jgi:hypothetical protein